MDQPDNNLRSKSRQDEGKKMSGRLSSLGSNLSSAWKASVWGRPRPVSNRNTKGVFSHFLSLVYNVSSRGAKIYILFLIVITIISSSLTAYTPYVYRRLIDDINSHRAYTIDAIVVMTYLGLLAAGRILSSLRWGAYARIEQQIQRRIMLVTYDKVHSLPYNFHLMKRVGGLQQTISDGLLGYRYILLNCIMVGLPVAVTILSISVFLYQIDQSTILLAILVMCVLHLSSVAIGVERQHRLQRAAQQHSIEMFARATDSFLNFESIKVFNAEARIRSSLDSLLRKQVSKMARMYDTRLLISMSQSIILVCGLVFIMFFSLQEIMAGRMTVGAFVMVNTYIIQLWSPLDALSFAYKEMKIGITFFERLIELLSMREAYQGPRGVGLTCSKGDVEFRGVTFSYDGKHKALDAVDFSAPAGRFTAVVGPSGSGKSTFVRLLMRFHEISSGSICVGGQDISDVDTAKLRSAIGIVPQDVILFNDTIFFNVGIGRPEVTDEAIYSACRAAGVHEFTDRLPARYDTVVGERGLAMSGGEKQRVAIARLILKDPDIIIFDEATSALDTLNERAIQNVISDQFANVTRIVVAHRLSTVREADKIIVFDRGRIAQQGRHDELFATPGLYREMWMNQVDAGEREQRPDAPSEVDRRESASEERSARRPVAFPSSNG